MLRYEQTDRRREWCIKSGTEQSTSLRFDVHTTAFKEFVSWIPEHGSNFQRHQKTLEYQCTSYTDLNGTSDTHRIS